MGHAFEEPWSDGLFCILVLLPPNTESFFSMFVTDFLLYLILFNSGMAILVNIYFVFTLCVLYKFSQPSQHLQELSFLCFFFFFQVVVPPLPGKAFLRQLPFRGDDGIFDDNFIKERKQGLELFINNVAGHPLAQNERCLRMFLQDEIIDKSYTPSKIRHA